MFSILVAVVQFAETVVTRSLGAALIGVGVVGTVAAGRWILAASPEGVACPGEGDRGHPQTRYTIRPTGPGSGRSG